MSAAIDQGLGKPLEWGTGAGGYGRRVANIEGQYSIQRTVTFLSSSALHEDNRYFRSGKHGVWPRVSYAPESAVLARRDDGLEPRSLGRKGILPGLNAF